MQIDKVFCRKPFEFFEVEPNGNARVCCEDWLPSTIGNLHTNTIEEVWNSKEAQDIRQSVLDGSYKFCNKEVCPSLVKKSLPKTDEVKDPMQVDIIKSNKVILLTGPKTLNLGYDNSCNLKCPTCRTELISLKGEDYDNAEKIQNQILETGLKDASDLIITGHGDAFGSTLFRKFLQKIDAEKFPAIKIDLMTNGLLFTPFIWESMKSAHKIIRSVSISIDAATEETYKINRGGNFNKLLSNLSFIQSLVEKKELQYFELSFVVQNNNFLEMESFVNMAISFGCTSVLFQRLIHWQGIMTYESYLSRAVHLSFHTSHSEFVKELEKPIFKHPIVDMSNLHTFL